MALNGVGDAVTAALDNLAAIAAQVQVRWPQLPLHFDLAELRGYGYQTGVVFAAFVPGCGQEVARGGRYDQIGEVFGRARPATGFSADLRTLMALSQSGEVAPRGAVFAPASYAPDLAQRIADLRASGEQVIRALPGQAGGAREMGCDREFVQQGDQWALKKL
jgi:ATP phosphoribosyltransferase regulatory subunit